MEQETVDDPIYNLDMHALANLLKGNKVPVMVKDVGIVVLNPPQGSILDFLREYLQ